MRMKNIRCGDLRLRPGAGGKPSEKHTQANRLAAVVTVPACDWTGSDDNGLLHPTGNHR